MTGSRKISEAEFARKWRPLFQGIFACPVPEPIFPQTSPFRDPRWVKVAIPNDFSGGWACLPFGPRDVDGDPEGVFLDVTVPFYETLSRCGMREIVITNETFLIDPAHITCLATAADQVEALELAPFMDGPRFLFSEEASWGLVTSWEDTSLLGGTQEFMDVYLENAGGLEAVMKLFQITDVESGGFGDKGIYDQKHVDAYYAMLAWPRPPVIEDRRTRQAEVMRRANELKNLMKWDLPPFSERSYTSGKNF